MRPTALLLVCSSFLLAGCLEDYEEDPSLAGIEVTSQPLSSWAPQCSTVDYDDDGIVGMLDFSVFRQRYLQFQACFGLSVVDEPSCESSDLTGDGVVGIPDFGLLKQEYTTLRECFGLSAP